MGRSDALGSVWAKSARDDSGALAGWLPLWTHAADAAGVAGCLWDDWLLSSVRRRIARDLDGDERSARTLLRFLAGVHDLGKATPAFAVQATHAIAQLSDDMRLCGLAMPRVLPPTERRKAPHGLAGHVLLVQWLVERGWDRKTAQGYAVVVGGHHGVPPSAPELISARPGAPTAHLLGDGTWEHARAELLEQVVTATGAEEWLDFWGVHHLSPPTQALLTGLVIVADWLASNPDFFPLALPGRQPDQSAEGRIDGGWRAVNLPRPWRARDAGESADDMLRSRFGLSAGAVARPLQEAAVRAARAMDPYGLLIIEGPMGVGKTEAGMLAAEILAARTGAGGVFVALPTQATSDAMFKRLKGWVTQVPESRPTELTDGGGVLSGRAVHLAHGKAWLNPAYADMPRWSGPATVDIARDEGIADRSRKGQYAETWGAAYVDRWMTGRKKGVLADFFVGTIDQVLVGALQARHVALRHLALARKVVILDEVHAADVCMSATLPSGMRARLLEASQSGRQPTGPAASEIGTKGLRTRLRRPGTEARKRDPLVTSSRLTYRRRNRRPDVTVGTDTTFWARVTREHHDLGAGAQPAQSHHCQPVNREGTGCRWSGIVSLSRQQGDRWLVRCELVRFDRSRRRPDDRRGRHPPAAFAARDGRAVIKRWETRLMPGITFELLMEASSPGGATCLTSRTALEPAAGPQASVAPAKFAQRGRDAGVYAYERRYLDGQPARAVLIDSKQSQLNRGEDALRQAIDDGHPVLSRLPRVELAYDRNGEREVYTDLDLPHRIFDGHIRAGSVGGTPLTQLDAYKAVRNATPANARALLDVSPISLLFGSWDSSRASRQGRWRSVLVGEVVGFCSEGEAERKGGARTDPVGMRIELTEAAMKQLAADQRHELSTGTYNKIVKESVKGKGGKPVAAPSTLGLGGIPPTLEALA